MRHACPACGFRTLKGDWFGTYDICDVCGWEDDHVQFANPAEMGGANGTSLIEWQVDAVATYPLTVAEADGVDRDPAWRPLSPAEIARAEADRAEACWKNRGIGLVTDAYWLTPS